jgi:hypothetical protein
MPVFVKHKYIQPIWYTSVIITPRKMSNSSQGQKFFTLPISPGCHFGRPSSQSSWYSWVLSGSKAAGSRIQLRTSVEYRD